MKNRQAMIEELFDISTEIEARELGGNCILEKYFGSSYVDLCNRGIEIFEELKKNETD